MNGAKPGKSPARIFFVKLESFNRFHQKTGRQCTNSFLGRSVGPIKNVGKATGHGFCLAVDAAVSERNNATIARLAFRASDVLGRDRRRSRKQNRSKEI
jgi:hypothetical protein